VPLDQIDNAMSGRRLVLRACSSNPLRTAECTLALTPRVGVAWELVVVMQVCSQGGVGGNPVPRLLRRL